MMKNRTPRDEQSSAVLTNAFSDRNVGCPGGRRELGGMSCLVYGAEAAPRGVALAIHGSPGHAGTMDWLAPALVPYSRHFCYEDGFKVGCPASQGCIPFYSPCCGGAPGRHFPCKHLIPPPAFYSTASDLPSFCANRKSMGGVEKLEVPADYPDLSPNPRSRQYHKIDDEFRRGFKRQANGKS